MADIVGLGKAGADGRKRRRKHSGGGELHGGERWGEKVRESGSVDAGEFNLGSAWTTRRNSK